MTLLTRHKTKDSPYFQMKIIILIALQGVKFPEGERPPPSFPLDTPLLPAGVLHFAAMHKSSVIGIQFFSRKLKLQEFIYCPTPKGNLIRYLVDRPLALLLK